MKRVIILVIDGLGVGEAPDAKEYGDKGSDTLGNICKKVPKLKVPNLARLGLFNITGINVDKKKQPSEVYGNYGKCLEQSYGKNSPVGHWEIAGYINKNKYKTYKNGFPKRIIDEFVKEANIEGVLCNKVGSGTEVLKKYGEKMMKTQKPIVYTSADSVFQIAAHEDVIPVEELYEICKAARKVCDKYNIGTVIARPFIGNSKDGFTRTYNRRDFETNTFGKTMLDVIAENGGYTIGIGKIGDLFCERGLCESIRTQGNKDGLDRLIEKIKDDNHSEMDLIFANLVDTDMLYGHRNDVEGYAKALEEIDEYLETIMEELKDNDVLIITGDHGNDPVTESTDHSREYIPLLVYGNNLFENVDLGIRDTFADISATVLDMLGIGEKLEGKSFRFKIEDY